MVRPDEKAENGDGDARQGNEFIAEYLLAGEDGNDLADDAHARQDHDVDGGMRIEPEEMLKKQRIAAQRRVEDSDMKTAFHGNKEEGDCDHRRAKHLDDASGVHGPNEQGQAEPSEARSAHAVDGHNEIEAGEDGREPSDEDAGCREDDVGVGVRSTERRIESPSSVDAAHQHGVHDQ